jgi:hypothetical protein
VALTNGWKSAATLVAGGVIGVLLAPTLAPALAGLARPAAKFGIKTGLLLFERSRIAAAELRETVEDIAAEVRAELEQEQTILPPESADAPASTDVVH